MDANVTHDFTDRELRRRQLAQRLVMHQARTQTIFLLTGLTRHQLATLRQRWRITQELRHRGPRPKSFAVFRSTLRAREEAAALAVLWKIVGDAEAVNGGSRKKLSPVEMGERLCEVFEIFVASLPKAELELEHLALLVRGLEQGDAIALANCASCGAVVLVDLLGACRRFCSHCQRAADDCEASTSEPGTEKEGLGSTAGAGGAVQQELF